MTVSKRGAGFDLAPRVFPSAGVFCCFLVLARRVVLTDRGELNMTSVCRSATEFWVT